MPAKKPTRVKKRSRKYTPTTDPAQSARFLETATKLGADESGAAFDAAFAAIVGKIPTRTGGELESETDVSLPKPAGRRAGKGKRHG